MMNDSIEFYGPSGALIAQVASSMVPPVGAFISIKKRVWQVRRITYALDNSDDVQQKRMRCNINLEAS